MQNFIKTIINAVQSWTKKEIKDSTADWSQNDPSASNYVKNRTHGLILSDIVPKMTVNITEDGGYECLGVFPTLIAGEIYTVTLNGVSYKCKARYCREWNCIGLGNGAFFGADSIDNGEPFFIDSYDDGEIYLNTIAVGEYAVSILVSVIKKLDYKYLDLPTNLATTDDIEEAMELINNEMRSAKDYIVLRDISDGKVYEIVMQNGNIVSRIIGSLEDFTYIVNSNGEYIITGWKQTLHGKPSTIMLVPDDVIL